MAGDGIGSIVRYHENPPPLQIAATTHGFGGLPVNYVLSPVTLNILPKIQNMGHL
jgi:hypothetical protein